MSKSTHESGELLSEHVQNSQFRIYNRLTATKPLQFFVNVLNMGEDVRAEVRPKSPDATDDSDSAYLNASTAVNGDLLGIRLGAYFEGRDHVFVIDAAIEYELDCDVLSFEDDDVAIFVNSVAAPRIAISTWTLIEEAAAAVEYRFNSKMVIPPEAVTESVLNSYRRAKKKSAKADTDSPTQNQ